MPIKPGIYVIADLDAGRAYLGSSNNLEMRLRAHNKLLIQGAHTNRHLQKAANDKHRFACLPIPVTVGVDILKLEQQLLDEFFDSGILYNIARDATAPMRGIIQPAEHVEKRRQANIGKKHSPETIARLSEIAKARGMPRAVIDAGIEARRGKPLTAAHVEKVRAASKARMTPEARAHLSKVNKGIPHTPEAIAVMRERCSNRTFSPQALEARQKALELKRALKFSDVG